MSDFMVSVLIIMSEATVFLAIVIIITLFFRIRAGITLKRTAKQFVQRIKNGDSEHSEKLKNILLNDYALDDTSASNAVDNLIQQEHLLYSKVIELYLGASDTNLTDIDADVKNLTKVMHGVTISSVSNTIQKSKSGTKNLSGEVNELQQELKKVKAEKEKVQKELKDAMATMEGMMTEYASMYAGGVREGDVKMREEIEKVKDRKSDFQEKGKSDDNENINDADSSTNKNTEIDLNLDVPDLDIDESNKP